MLTALSSIRMDMMDYCAPAIILNQSAVSVLLKTFRIKVRVWSKHSASKRYEFNNIEPCLGVLAYTKFGLSINYTLPAVHAK